MNNDAAEVVSLEMTHEELQADLTSTGTVIKEDTVELDVPKPGKIIDEKTMAEFDALSYTNYLLKPGVSDILMAPTDGAWGSVERECKRVNPDMTTQELTTYKRLYQRGSYFYSTLPTYLVPNRVSTMSSRFAQMNSKSISVRVWIFMIAKGDTTSFDISAIPFIHELTASGNTLVLILPHPMMCRTQYTSSMLLKQKNTVSFGTITGGWPESPCPYNLGWAMKHSNVFFIRYASWDKFYQSIYGTYDRNVVRWMERYVIKPPQEDIKQANAKDMIQKALLAKRNTAGRQYRDAIAADERRIRDYNNQVMAHFQRIRQNQESLADLERGIDGLEDAIEMALKLVPDRYSRFTFHGTWMVGRHNPIVITYSGKNYDIGPLDIGLDLVNSNVRIFGIDGEIRNKKTDNPHPHVYGDGSPCLGSHGFDQILALAGVNQLYGTFLQLSNQMMTYNAGSPVCYISNFPLYEPKKPEEPITATESGSEDEDGNTSDPVDNGSSVEQPAATVVGNEQVVTAGSGTFYTPTVTSSTAIYQYPSVG